LEISETRSPPPREKEAEELRKIFVRAKFRCQF